ncbi:uncharacterized protein LOC117115315 [Anneissia japonica]|uniref:uncharacterized protein LOC117115315 n=1 Tax=Anneissia japonica TaxID=1529436 RepID=UPI001425B039|nr:uncharacterized protein LOC117115315 [Anneissia japonica]
MRTDTTYRRLFRRPGGSYFFPALDLASGYSNWQVELDQEAQQKSAFVVICEYNIEIQHRPGTKHGNADGLSRRPCKQCGRVKGGVEKEPVQIEPGESHVEPQVPLTRIEPELSLENLRAQQLEDPSINWVLTPKEAGNPCHNLEDVRLTFLYEPGYVVVTNVPAKSHLRRSVGLLCNIGPCQNLWNEWPWTSQAIKYVLVVGDYLTRWTEAYPIPDQTADTVTKSFVEKFVLRFGVLAQLHTDQGRNFESKVLAEACRMLGIKKTRTTPYNPKSDGMVERFNRTLINMVAMMLDPVHHQRDLDERLPYATFVYRSTPQESTGESPNMLMLGTEVRTPIDLSVEVPQTMPDEPDLATRVRSQLQKAGARARDVLKISARRQKKGYDKLSEEPNLVPGKFVWTYDQTKRKGMSPKLECRWKGPYLIIDKLTEVTFRIQLSPRGARRVVHCDQLKPYEGNPTKVPAKERQFALSPERIQIGYMSAQVVMKRSPPETNCGAM